MFADFWKWFTTGESAIGLFAIGVAMGFFVGQAVYRYFHPAEKVLELKLKESERQLTEANAQHDEFAGQLTECKSGRLAAQTKVDNFDAIREALFGQEDELWQLHAAAPPVGYLERLARSKPKIVMIANLKGGVGKTTITANLAAYFEKRWGKRVLAIDLDYQGSLSETLLRTAGLDFAGSLADDFIAGTRNGADLLRLARPLNPALPKTHLITSNYDLARLENRLMLSWLLKETEGDIRFNLGEVLLHPEVQDEFDIILIDGPPRLSTAAVNALACSHYLIVPTIPDSMSIPAVARFMNSIGNFLPALNPALQLAGVALNLAAGGTLNGREVDSIARLSDEFAMSGMNGHIYEQHIPRLAALANVAGRDVLYLREKAFREGTMELFGAEVARSIGFGELR